MTNQPGPLILAETVEPAEVAQAQAQAVMGAVQKLDTVQRSAATGRSHEDGAAGAGLLTYVDGEGVPEWRNRL